MKITGMVMDKNIMLKAIEETVAKSDEYSQKLEGQLTELLGAVKVSIKTIKAKEIPYKSEDMKNQKSPVEEVSTAFKKFGTKVESLFDNQKRVMSSVNIVEFGRTGAGKSTLNEALTHGDGKSISEGESDWTTDVVATSWGKCKLYDTPGIAGWGRTESRSELEEKAREAVEYADLVIICFDSQSQQAGEFAKVAEWVKTFNKPCVCVLNNRNQKWRCADQVSRKEARRNLSRSVKDHKFNIEAGLQEIGLHYVPIVSINSQKAYFSRLQGEYSGPERFRRTYEVLLERYGSEKLHEISNLEALETLLVNIISGYAVKFREEGLNDKVRVIVEQFTEEIKEAELKIGINVRHVEDTLIEGMFKLVGYPSDTDRDLFDFDEKYNLLNELEQVRGECGNPRHFESSEDGEVGQVVRDRLKSLFQNKKTESMTLAENLFLSRFDAGEEFDGNEIFKNVIDEKALKKIVDKFVEEELVEIVNERMETTFRGFNLDLIIQNEMNEWHSGKAGKTRKRVGLGLRFAGLGAGAVATLGTFAALNIWNPLGWAAGVAGVVAIVGGLISGLFGWFGSKQRVKAEQERLEARTKGIAQIRSGITKAYNKYIKVLAKELSKSVWASYKESYRDIFVTAISLRNIAYELKALRGVLANQRKGMKKAGEPQKDIQVCVGEVEAEFLGRRETADDLWLGENWINFQDGLLDGDDLNEEQMRRENFNPSLVDKLFSSINSFFDDLSEGVTAKQSDEWLVKLRERFAEEQFLSNIFFEVDANFENLKAQIFLVGDYNAGKSSFIKRVLVDDGQPVPDTLTIKASPETDRVHKYLWREHIIVDTPGLQAREEHDEVTFKYLAEASFVIYVVQPNLIIGDDHFLKTVFLGNKERGLLPKKDRTIILINRADDIGGIDPELDPKFYFDSIERKQKELVRILEDKGIDFDMNRIFAISSDPFQLVGARSDVTKAEYDPYRKWDGMKQFYSQFYRNQGKLSEAGVNRAKVESYIARLVATSFSIKDSIKEDQFDLFRTEKFNNVLIEQLLAGRRIKEGGEEDISSRVEQYALDLFESVLSYPNKELIHKSFELNSEWWSSKKFGELVNLWQKEFHVDSEDWRRKTASRIDRTLENPIFNNVLENINPDTNFKNVKNESHWLKTVFDKVEFGLKNANHGNVYKIGKAIGIKFKPYGAKNAANILGKAGGILAAVGLAWDAYDIWSEGNKMHKLESVRKDMREGAKLQAKEVIGYLITNMSEDEGPLGQCVKVLNELDAKIISLNEKKNELNESIIKKQDLLNRVEESIKEGLAILGKEDFYE